MRKNLSQVDPALSVKGLNQNLSQTYKHTRKLEGSDVPSKSFAAKVQHLKGRPTQETLEDQYVKGLQDQIQYLELELKLLKDKEAAKQGQFDQLQKFFGDGIPINENILAIKNGFNNYKKTYEKRISEVQNEKAQREGLIEDLRVRADAFLKEVKQSEKQLRTLEKEQSNRYHELLGKEAALKRRIEIQDEQLRTLKTENRKMAETMSSIHRNKEIEMVVNLKNDNHKHTKLAKFKEQMSEKQVELDQLIKEYDGLREQEEEKTYVVNIEQQNVNLKKKIISMEKEFNALRTKADELKMDLEAKLKERQKQINARVQMKDRVEKEKSSLSRENSLSVQEIEKYVKERELELLKRTVEKNKKLSKYTSYYSELLTKVEDSIQELVEKKPELKSQLSVFGADIVKLLKSIQEEQERETTLLCDFTKEEARCNYLKSAIPALLERLKKNTDQTSVLSNECNILGDEIKIKEKQLELVTILKNLSLEETEISKSTSGTIQERLVNFIRSWQSLQKTN